MKKIMFNDQYGLTDAVLEGRKTMTRRLIKMPDFDVEYLDTAFDWDFRESVIIDQYSRYKVGEIVAVAQSYKDIYHLLPDNLGPLRVSNGYLHESPGATNKMFVLAHVMPHRIRITKVRIERLQDISDDDCLREGIYEVPFCEFSWEDNGETFKTARDAFAALIDEISNYRMWASNPYVFVYEFELVK